MKYLFENGIKVNDDWFDHNCKDFKGYTYAMNVVKYFK